MDLYYEGGFWYVNGQQNKNFVDNWFKPIGKSVAIYWVRDELTFYRLLKLFEADLEKIKVNFYEFRCIGFNYKNVVFKQCELRGVGGLLGIGEKYSYSYGAYALNLLKDLIKQQAIKATHTPQVLKSKLRKAFIGGRNEFIEEPITRRKIFSIDFNAMYLNCLKTEFLSGDIYFKQTDRFEGPGFYYISFEGRNQDYPVLFVRNKYTEQGYFCDGGGEGLFWHEEIQLFLSQGGSIKKIHYAYMGGDYTRNFQPFISKIQNSNNPKLAKQLANNLYGRLAMKDFRYPVKLATDLEFYAQCENNAVKCWTKWYDFFIYESVVYTNYYDYTDICAAAALTAKARIKLFHLVQNLKIMYQICLLNTDEVILTSADDTVLCQNFDVKIRQISEEVFLAKKKMFYSKRKVNEDGTSRPFKNISGMLL